METVLVGLLVLFLPRWRRLGILSLARLTGPQDERVTTQPRPWKRSPANDISRAVRRTVGGHTFRVPSPEERVLITTLRRMYRHFYCRLCDIVDTTKLIQAQELDYTILLTAAESSGIWPGVATFLVTVAEYARVYGAELELLADVISSATTRRRSAVAGGFPAHVDCASGGRPFLAPGALRRHPKEFTNCGPSVLAARLGSSGVCRIQNHRKR